MKKISSRSKMKMQQRWDLFPTLRNYDFGKQLVPDIVAGLTVGSLAVPQSMSYAMIAGLPVQNGLYSDLQVAYPVLGSSKHLVVGPVAIMSLLTMGALRGTGLEPLTEEWIILCSLLSFSVGCFQLAFAATKMGEWISNAVSENTVKAFTACAALTIASTQLSSLLGIICKTPENQECGVVGIIAKGLFYEPNITSLMVSAASFAVLEGTRVSFQGNLISKMGSLVVLLLGCSMVALFGPYGVKTVGYIPHGLPSSSPILYFPSVEAEHLFRVILFAGPISLLGFAEAYAIAKMKSSDSLDPNKELAALGLANIWTAFLGGYACTGSFSRSAVNAEAGSTSGASAFVAAGLVILVLQVLTTPLSLLPRASVAAVVVSAILRLCDYQYPAYLYRTNRLRELVSFASIFVSGLAFGVEFGLMLGFAIDTYDRCNGRPSLVIAKDMEEEKNPL